MVGRGGSCARGLWWRRFRSKAQQRQWIALQRKYIQSRVIELTNEIREIKVKVSQGTEEDAWAREWMQEHFKVRMFLLHYGHRVLPAYWYDDDIEWPQSACAAHMMPQLSGW